MIKIGGLVQTPHEEVLATITAGATQTEDVDSGGLRLFSVAVPSSFGAGAITLSFEEYSAVLDEWFTLYMDGAAYTKEVVPGISDNVDISRFSSVKRLRIKIAAVQGSDLPIALVFRPVQ
ncbi:MAG: hypothetical protein AB7S81_08350 [Bdellovibrionales bacterium]